MGHCSCKVSIVEDIVVVWRGCCARGIHLLTVTTNDMHCYKGRIDQGCSGCHASAHSIALLIANRKALLQSTYEGALITKDREKQGAQAACSYGRQSLTEVTGSSDWLRLYFAGSRSFISLLI